MILRRAALAAALCASALPLRAASRVAAELVPESLTAAAGAPFLVAVRLKMDPGWHTYWKNPGDSGLATRVSWALPPGFSAGPLQWPAPEKFGAAPVIDFGYAGEAWLLAVISVPPDASGRVELRADVRWLECADVCVPGRAALSRTVTVALKAGPPEQAEAFAAARGRIPAEDAGARAVEEGGRIAVRLAAPAAIDPSAVEFFPENAALSRRLAPPRVGRNGADLELVFDEREGESRPDRIEGVLKAPAAWRPPDPRRALRLDVPVKKQMEGKR